jgi:hypothetical protein
MLETILLIGFLIVLAPFAVAVFFVGVQFAGDCISSFWKTHG